MNSRFTAAVVLLLVGATSGWTPLNHRIKPTTRKVGKDFRPTQWAAVGILTASLILAPLAPPAHAATDESVRVEVEGNSLVIKLDLPELKAGALREAFGAGKIKATVKEEPNDNAAAKTTTTSKADTTAVKEETSPAATIVKEEPKEAVPKSLMEKVTEALSIPNSDEKKDEPVSEKSDAPKANDVADKPAEKEAPTEAVKTEEPKTIMEKVSEALSVTASSDKKEEQTSTQSEEANVIVESKKATEAPSNDKKEEPKTEANIVTEPKVKDEAVVPPLIVENEEQTALQQGQPKIEDAKETVVVEKEVKEAPTIATPPESKNEEVKATQDAIVEKKEKDESKADAPPLALKEEKTVKQQSKPMESVVVEKKEEVIEAIVEKKTDPIKPAESPNVEQLKPTESPKVVQPKSEEAVKVAAPELSKQESSKEKVPKPTVTEAPKEQPHIEQIKEGETTSPAEVTKTELPPEESVAKSQPAAVVEEPKQEKPLPTKSEAIDLKASVVSPTSPVEKAVTQKEVTKELEKPKDTSALVRSPAPVDFSETFPDVAKLWNDFVSERTENAELAPRTKTEELSYWERPAFKIPIQKRMDGGSNGDLRLVFSNLDVARASAIGLALASATNYFLLRPLAEGEQSGNDKEKLKQGASVAPMNRPPNNAGTSIPTLPNVNGGGAQSMPPGANRGGTQPMPSRINGSGMQPPPQSSRPLTGGQMPPPRPTQSGPSSSFNRQATTQTQMPYGPPRRPNGPLQGSANPPPRPGRSPNGGPGQVATQSQMPYGPPTQNANGPRTGNDQYSNNANIPPRSTSMSPPPESAYQERRPYENTRTRSADSNRETKGGPGTSLTPDTSRPLSSVSSEDRRPTKEYKPDIGIIYYDDDVISEEDRKREAMKRRSGPGSGLNNFGRDNWSSVNGADKRGVPKRSDST